MKKASPALLLILLFYWCWIPFAHAMPPIEISLFVRIAETALKDQNQTAVQTALAEKIREAEDCINLLFMQKAI